MEMLKLRIKLNFNNILFVIFLFNVILSQAIFVDDGSKTIHSLYGDYVKRHNFKDYNYSISYGLLFNGKIEFGISYIKENQFYRDSNSSNEISEWDEFSRLSLSYHLKSKKFLSYAISTAYNLSNQDNQKNKSSFSFLINKKFNRNITTGLIYAPYLEFNKEYFGEYFDVLKSIKDAETLYENFDNIELGCYISFLNDIFS